MSVLTQSCDLPQSESLLLFFPQLEFCLGALEFCHLESRKI